MKDFTSLKITLSDHERLCLSNIRKTACFRSESQTIGECLLFIQALRDNPDCLEILGKRFGINKTNKIGEK